MTVAELIEKLKTFPQELPVCLADWNEDYREPSGDAMSLTVKAGKYLLGQEFHEGDFLQIG